MGIQDRLFGDRAHHRAHREWHEMGATISSAFGRENQGDDLSHDRTDGADAEDAEVDAADGQRA